MKKLSLGVAALAALGIITLIGSAVLSLPNDAFAAGVSIQNLKPGTAVVAKSLVSFSVLPTGFTTPFYKVTDSFPGTSLTQSTMGISGSFNWVPAPSDVGTHTITVSVTDSDGNAAAATQVLTVLPPPSLAISNVSPATPSVAPGAQVTFTVIPSGFVSPRYSIGDQAGSTSINPNNLDANGNFSWKPEIADIGDHAITVYATDNEGHNAQAKINIRVGNGPQIFAGQPTPGSTIRPGQNVSLQVSSSNFTPTSYAVYDPFKGTTLTGSNIGASGLLMWTPSPADVGVHTITIQGIVGLLGATASTTVVLTVQGDGTQSASTQVASTTSVTDLQAKLAALQSALAQAKGTTGNTGTLVSTVAQTFTSLLKFGASGTEVWKLQNLLYEKGYMSVKPNGNFGPGTEAAVKKFQKANGLSQLGIVGPGTRAALNALATEDEPAVTTATTAATGTFVFEHFMGVGDDDPDVVELQKKLIALGYLEGDVTGYYGEATETAVKKFQKAKGLPQNGYCNRATRLLLNQN